MDSNYIWGTIGYWSHFAGAVICAILAVWVGRGRNLSSERKGARTALGLTAAWALIAAASNPLSFWALLAESARNLGWMFLLYRLFAKDGRHETIQPIRPWISGGGLRPKRLSSHQTTSSTTIEQTDRRKITDQDSPSPRRSSGMSKVSTMPPKPVMASPLM